MLVVHFPKIRNHESVKGFAYFSCDAPSLSPRGKNNNGVSDYNIINNNGISNSSSTNSSGSTSDNSDKGNGSNSRSSEKTE